MTKLFNISIIAIIIVTIIVFSGCTDQYENHALAFRNNTQDSIQVDRYYANTVKPRTTMIAPDEYGKFYETSSDMWVTPSVEISKSCDSLILTGLKNDEPFQIVFTPDKTEGYCSSPYSANADWLLEVYVTEEPKFLGKTLERFNVHIFEINSSCISTIQN
ncbi:MAG: hypothetical protein JXR36_05175 [Bacteroidales bacterium]|nr:hypothetical protein [Bacteroidales bacterium]